MTSPPPTPPPSTPPPPTTPPLPPSALPLLSPPAGPSTSPFPPTTPPSSPCSLHRPRLPERRTPCACAVRPKRPKRARAQLPQERGHPRGATARAHSAWRFQLAAVTLEIASSQCFSVGSRLRLGSCLSRASTLPVAWACCGVGSSSEPARSTLTHAATQRAAQPDPAPPPFTLHSPTAPTQLPHPHQLAQRSAAARHCQPQPAQCQRSPVHPVLPCCPVRFAFCCCTGPSTAQPASASSCACGLGCRSGPLAQRLRLLASAAARASAASASPS
jgi:hypothetical protein